MNSYAIEFETSHIYDTLKTGITIPVTLQYDSLTIDFEAKLDTGSSHFLNEDSAKISVLTLKTERSKNSGLA